MSYTILDNIDAQTWNGIIHSLYKPHILQSYQWGEFKSHYGWAPYYLLWKEDDRILAAAMVLHRCISIIGVPLRNGIMYVPRGPLLLNWENTSLLTCVLMDLTQFAKLNRAMFIKIDPDMPQGSGLPGEIDSTDEPAGQTIAKYLHMQGWQKSDEQIQFRNTVVIDLQVDENVLLARMKQKTRYNIHLAERKGVKIRSGHRDDFPVLYKMYNETAQRDGFIIREEKYYQTIWETFFQNQISTLSVEELKAGKFHEYIWNQITPVCEPLIAEFEGMPVAGLILFRFAGQAWYLYGMSRNIHREKMSNHLLQWEAIKRAKAAGCVAIDLWGAPDEYNERDPMFGVYRFKVGLGGQTIRFIGAWDYPIHSFFYKLYMKGLPWILEIMRGKARSRIRKEVSRGFI